MRKSASLASPIGADLPGYTRPGHEFWNRVPFKMQLQWCPGTNVTVDPRYIKRTSKYSKGPDGLIKNWCTSEERMPVSFFNKEGCFFLGDKAIRVESRECQNSTMVTASGGGTTIHSDEAQWLVTNATHPAGPLHRHGDPGTRLPGPRLARSSPHPSPPRTKCKIPIGIKFYFCYYY